MTHTERKMADAIFYELSSRNSPLDSPAQASIEVDDALEYRILAEEDGGEYRPERFSCYVEALEGLLALYPAPNWTVTVRRSIRQARQD